MTPPTRLRDLPPAARTVLLALTLGGAALRVAYQSERFLGGDEIGTLVNLGQDYRVLLTTFRDPWLTMNAYIAAIKALSAASGGNLWVMLAPTLLAGFAIVPLTAALALRLAGPAAVLGAALLAAANPYLTFYGVQLRSYMLLAAGTTASLVAFLDWRTSRTWRDGWWCALAAAAALLMHANGVYFLLCLAVLLVHDVATRPGTLAVRLRPLPSLLVPLACALLPVAASYWPLRAGMAEFRTVWSAPAPTTVGYLPWILGAYFGRGVALLPSLALLAWALWDASQRNHRLLIAAVGVAVPMIAASWLGVSHFPWAYARFFLTGVPLLLVLIAAGAAALPGGVALRTIALLVVVASWTPSLWELHREERDHPWDRIAAHLRATTAADDLLLTTDDGSSHAALALGPHLDPHGARFAPVGPWLAAGTPPARLVLVNPNLTLVGIADTHTIGAVQLLAWDGPTRTAVLEAAVADLERVLDRRIAPGLSGAYRTLLELRAALGRPDTNGEYTALRYECFMRTRRQRHKPLQQLGIEGGE